METMTFMSVAPEAAINKETGKVEANFPVKYINPHNDKECTAWISRSSATSLFVFAPDFVRKWYDPSTWFKKQNWFVLAEKRGKGCPDFVGYWCCICGYLDWHETFAEAAIRELHEETGVVLSKSDIFEDLVSSDPENNLENITARHIAILNYPIQNYIPYFSTEFMESNEVDDIKFVPINNIDEYQWAFDHENIIVELFNKYINCPWWKKVIRSLYNKYCK